MAHLHGQSFNMISFAFIISVSTILAVLLLAPWSRTDRWQATVTPLASIIGSGFLVSAPLLAGEFGGFAALSIAFLIVVAWLIGWTIRYNIRVVEPQLIGGGDRVLHSVEAVSHIVLAFAYFVSIAYYLSLLGHFLLEAVGVQNELFAKVISISLIIGLGLLGWSGGTKKVASVERYATSLNLSVIAGFLVSLAVFSALRIAGGETVLPPPGKFDAGSIPVLMGLLIVVQGFETSRFMGSEYDAPTRISAMRNAQLISGVIYILFFILLSPMLAELANGEGVAAIISVSALVAVVLPISLTIAATGSQLSASVADSIGNVGLIRSLTHGKVDSRHSYALVSLVGVTILVTSEVNQVIALASRAFALFYSLQCFVACDAARKRPEDRGKSWVFAVLALTAAAVCIFGAPFE